MDDSWDLVCKPRDCLNARLTPRTSAARTISSPDRDRSSCPVLMQGVAWGLIAVVVERERWSGIEGEEVNKKKVPQTRAGERTKPACATTRAATLTHPDRLRVRPPRPPQRPSIYVFCRPSPSCDIQLTRHDSDLPQIQFSLSCFHSFLLAFPLLWPTRNECSGPLTARPSLSIWTGPI
jgi:hypothetical protein